MSIYPEIALGVCMCDFRMGVNQHTLHTNYFVSYGRPLIAIIKTFKRCILKHAFRKQNAFYPLP